MKAEDDTRMTRNSKQRIKNGVDKVRREQALVYEKLQPLEHLGAEIDLCGAFEKKDVETSSKSKETYEGKN